MNDIKSLVTKLHELGDKSPDLDYIGEIYEHLPQDAQQKLVTELQSELKDLQKV